MANTRKPCPYATATDLEAAIQAHGGIERLSESIKASPNTIRGWARRLGAKTTSGAKPGAKEKACPFATAEELLAAIDEAGTLQAFSEQSSVAPHTVRKWMRTFGVSLRQSRRSGEQLLLDEATDAELEALISCLGYKRLAQIFDVTDRTVREHAAKRGLQAQTKASPRVNMLTRRVRELESEREALDETLQEIRQAAVEFAADPPLPLPRTKIKPHRKTPVDVVLHVSDKQYGEVVHEEDTPGGRYSPEIYEQERLPRYVAAAEALLENVRHANPINTVWFAQGGDFVEGHGVFRGQEWHLALDAGSQIVRLSHAWAEAMAQIATYAKSLKAERVAVTSVVGNHGVPQGRAGGAVPPTLNFDYLCYESIRHQLAGMPNNGGVDWYDAEARKAVYFETVGGVVLLTHGDQDRGGGLVGAPVVTGLRNDLQVRLSTGVQHYLHLKGHYHRPTQITVGSDAMTWWSGAWIGTNNLSIGRGGASAPSQNIFVLHPEHGLIATHRVKLSESVESVPAVLI